LLSQLFWLSYGAGTTYSRAWDKNRWETLALSSTGRNQQRCNADMRIQTSLMGKNLINSPVLFQLVMRCPETNEDEHTLDKALSTQLFIAASSQIHLPKKLKPWR